MKKNLLIAIFLLGSATGIFGMDFISSKIKPLKNKKSIHKKLGVFEKLKLLQKKKQHNSLIIQPILNNSEFNMIKNFSELNQKDRLNAKHKQVKKEYDQARNERNEFFNKHYYGNIVYPCNELTFQTEELRLKLKKEQLDIIENKIKSIEDNRLNQFFVTGDASSLADYGNTDYYKHHEGIVRTWKKETYYTYLVNKIRLRNLTSERFQSHESLKDDQEKQAKQEKIIAAKILEITNVQNELILQVNKQREKQEEQENIQNQIRNATYNDPTRL